MCFMGGHAVDAVCNSRADGYCLARCSLTSDRISLSRSLAKMKSVSRLLVDCMMSAETPCHSL